MSRETASATAEAATKPRLAVIGAPSSAGAYAPGQEKAPAAVRAAGLIDLLRATGWSVDDLGDVPGFRWQVDRQQPRAMNAQAVARTARAVAERATPAFAAGSRLLVLGGDCTVELGTVAAALGDTRSVGLIYIDLDADLNTPASTRDGALDWMGVAHLLGLPDTLPVLAGIGPCVPLLAPEQLLHFAADNIEPFEQQQMDRLGLRPVRLAEVVADLAGSAQRALAWAGRFERLLVHVDLDVLDFVDAQLAENNRRNWGLTLAQLMSVLEVFIQAPNWRALTICELNPDHGDGDGAHLRHFAAMLATVLRPVP